MNKSLKFLLLLATPVLPMMLGSCGANNAAEEDVSGGNQTIHIVNVEDYIYENDPQNGYDAADLCDQFEEYVKANYPQYQNVKVVYDTTDTPETMYNELKTGKSQIDLMCPSDYMIQKMASEELIAKIPREKVPNYADFASPKVTSYLDNIEATNSKGETFTLGDYTVGYMWGTLGILFNPGYQDFKNKDEDTVIDDMQYWTTLWDKDYNGTISIKDSIRDTLAMVMMKYKEEELLDLYDKYLAGDATLEEYRTLLDGWFNIYSDTERFTNHIRNDIYNEMLVLKKNIYGLEVDNGKLDIVTRKIGVNLAWSGDAVYSISLAADPEQTSGKPFDLYFSVPKCGSNVWFDGWVMPVNDKRTPAQTELSYLFLDFLSDPDNAAQNMDYTGYTSFIAGDSILELARDWYDVRASEVNYVDEEENSYPVYSYDGSEYTALTYLDCVSTKHDSTRDLEVLFYDANADEDNPDYQPLYLLDEAGEETTTQKTYGDLLIVDTNEDYQEVDLSYVFNDTLDNYLNDVDTKFYAEDYYVGEDDNCSVGSSFFTQYPDEETINRCCIMKDFGANNKKILELWEDFKSGELPTWAIVLLSIEVTAAVAVGGYFIIKKQVLKKLRKSNDSKD